MWPLREGRGQVTDPQITVVIPVGPEKHHADYLDECLASLVTQTRQPDEVILIDDMHGLVPSFGSGSVDDSRGLRVQTWASPWRLGVAHAFNFGVALAENDLVFMLGADDVLAPTCLERCLSAYVDNQMADAYYWVDVEYNDGRTQREPCGAAMVTKGLWRRTGGFPPEAASGASDAALISMLLGNDLADDLLIHVVSDKPLYGYRAHNQSDTAQRGPWQKIIIESRNLLTQQFKEPSWGRYV